MVPIVAPNRNLAGDRLHCKRSRDNFQDSCGFCSPPLASDKTARTGPLWKHGARRPRAYRSCAMRSHEGTGSSNLPERGGKDEEPVVDGAGDNNTMERGPACKGSDSAIERAKPELSA